MTPSLDTLRTQDAIVRSTTDAQSLGMAFVIETRPDGSRRFVFAGPRCLPLNGVTGAAVMADSSVLFSQILPGHREAFIAAESAAIADLQPLDVEVAMRRPDGAVRWHRFAALPRAQPDGSVLWDGLQIDVTERREMALALSEQHRRLEMAAEATGLGFWEWDVEADTVLWSDRNRELFGLGPDDEVTVARYLELVHPDDVEAVQAAFAGAGARPEGGDYSLEHRAVTPAGEVRWMLTNGRVVTNPEGDVRLVVGTTLDISERKAAEERRTLLLGELAHRAKNGIAVVMAIVTQTARGQETVTGFQDQLMARLQAMADAQDLVTQTGGRPIAMTDVFEKALAPFGAARFDVDPALAGLTLRGDMAVGMGLLLYEMATNAVKYGALSNRRGRVAIMSEPAAEGRAAFRWREAGGPEVQAPSQPGFGTRLLNQALRLQGGEVTFEFHTQGFNARVEFPTVR